MNLKKAKTAIFFLGGKKSQQHSILAQPNRANDGDPSLEFKSDFSNLEHHFDQPALDNLSAEPPGQNSGQGSFFKKGTSARMHDKYCKTQGTSRRKDLSKSDRFLYLGTGGYNRFVQDHPSYFNYTIDHRYLERVIAAAESVLEIGAGCALMYFSCGTLCFVGQELLSMGFSSLWYTWQSGSDFDWSSFLMNKGVGLAFGALFQGCCVPCEIASYFMIANRKVTKEAIRTAVSVVVRSMSDSVKSDLVYTGDGLKAETYLKAFSDNAAAGFGFLAAKQLSRVLLRG